MDAKTVREIQEALRFLSFEDPRLLPLSVDGRYDQETKQAISIFQSLNDLDVTGITDKHTWEELVDQVHERTERKPDVLQVFPHPRFILQPNDKHEFVYILQSMLNSLSYIFDNLETVPINGQYDQATITEVQRIQTAHRIEPTGILDVQTWNIIAQLYNTRFDTTKR